MPFCASPDTVVNDAVLVPHLPLIQLAAELVVLVSAELLEIRLGVVADAKVGIAIKTDETNIDRSSLVFIKPSFRVCIRLAYYTPGYK